MQKPWSPWFYVIAYAVVLALNLSALVLVQAYALEYIELAGGAWLAIVLTCLVANLFLVAVVLVFWYRAWQTIQDGYARTTPGKAIGYCFIPLFNLYWVFQLTLGFCADHNRYLRRHEIRLPRLPMWPWVAWLIAALGPHVVLRVLPGGLSGVTMALAFGSAALFMVPFVQTAHAVGLLRKHASGAPIAAGALPWTRVWPWVVVVVAIPLGGWSSHLFPGDSPSSTVDALMIEVTASLARADATTMAETVALELEKEFAGLPYLEAMSSVSGNGATVISLRFPQSRDLEDVLVNVQSAIDRAEGRLPEDLSGPPSCRTAYPTALYLALSSSDQQVPIPMLTEHAEAAVVPRLSAVPGVEDVEIIGGQRSVVRVQLDFQRLVAQAITATEVAAAIREAGGATNLGDTVVGARNGPAVRLRDVASLHTGVEQEGIPASWADRRGSQQCVLLAVAARDQAGALSGVRSLVPALEQTLPSGVVLRLIDPAEEGHIICEAETEEGIRVETMTRLLSRLQDVLLREPAVESCITMPRSRPPFAGSTNTAVCLIGLRDQSSGGTEQVLETLRSRVDSIPGLSVRLHHSLERPLRYTLQGTDLDELDAAAARLLSRLSDVDFLRDGERDWRMTASYEEVELDQQRARLLGISAADIMDCVRVAFGGLPAAVPADTRDGNRLILESADGSPDFDEIQVRGGDGRLVPLTALVRLSRRLAPRVIRHTGLLPSVTLSWYLKAGVRKASARSVVEKTAQDVLRPGIEGRWTD